jgi:hypothetical protein
MKIQALVRELSLPQLSAIWQIFTSHPRSASLKPTDLLTQGQPDSVPERALILPFDQSSPSTRAERILRLNLLVSDERREEAPTHSFLPALQKLEVTERHATLADALNRLGFHVKSKRK